MNWGLGEREKKKREKGGGGILCSLPKKRGKITWAYERIFFQDSEDSEDSEDDPDYRGFGMQVCLTLSSCNSGNICMAPLANQVMLTSPLLTLDAGVVGQ